MIIILIILFNNEASHWNKASVSWDILNKIVRTLFIWEVKYAHRKKLSIILFCDEN